MSPENVIGVASIFLLGLAVLLLLLNYREGRYQFVALAFALSQVICLNLISTGMMRVNEKADWALAFGNNFLDAPLTLTFLLYFAGKGKSRKTVLTALGTFLVYELLVFLFMGMTTRSVVFILGPGLVLVTVFSFYFFIQQLQTAIKVGRKEIGRAFLVGGVVFTYLCFLLIYILFYIMETSHTGDVYMIYYITYSVWAITTTIGLALLMRRARSKPSPIVRSRQEDPNAFQYL